MPVVTAEGFEGDRDGADAAFDVRGGELAEQIEEPIRVGEPIRGGPIRGVNVLFHAGSVETSVGKSIDGKDVGVVVLEPALEGGKGDGLGELLGGEVAEPESDGKGLVRRHAGADSEGVAFECGQRFCPAFTAVDVGAISQVLTEGEFHGQLVGGQETLAGRERQALGGWECLRGPRTAIRTPSVGRGY